MTFRYDLTLGLPHTNHAGLSESLLMATAGNCQWASIAQAAGTPLSSLRTLAGGPVYATFYFIETWFPRDRPITSFTLDDRVTFDVSLRAFKNIVVEGRVVFDHSARMPDSPMPAEAPETHPWIRFGNIFITPEAGNSLLRIAPPANADLSGLPMLPNDQNPYAITREADATGRLGVIGDDWRCLDRESTYVVPYAVDPDRDTNGAGLVYFANYVAFLDSAERAAMQGNALRVFTPPEVSLRALHRRRIAYYGNVAPTDTVLTTVSMFAKPDQPDVLGVRSVMRRAEDQHVICRSEAIKVLGPTG